MLVPNLAYGTRRSLLRLHINLLAIPWHLSSLYDDKNGVWAKVMEVDAVESKETMEEFRGRKSQAAVQKAQKTTNSSGLGSEWSSPARILHFPMPTSDSTFSSMKRWRCLSAMVERLQALWNTLSLGAECLAPIAGEEEEEEGAAA